MRSHNNADIENDTELSQALALSYYEYTYKKIAVKNEAAQYGFKCKDVPRDGACFYHALADQLNRIYNNKTTYTADSLRETTKIHIKNNINLYQQFIMGSLSVFLAKLKNPGEWGDNIEILALSREFNINIVIIRSDALNPTIFKRLNAAHTVYLGYEVDEHYLSLIPEEKCSIATKHITSFLNTSPDDTIEIEQHRPSTEEEPAGYSVSTLLTYGLFGISFGLITYFAVKKINDYIDYQPNSP